MEDTASAGAAGVWCLVRMPFGFVGVLTECLLCLFHYCIIVNTNPDVNTNPQVQPPWRLLVQFSSKTFHSHTTPHQQFLSQFWLLSCDGLLPYIQLFALPRVSEIGYCLHDRWDLIHVQTAHIVRPELTVFYGPLYPRNVHIHSGGVQYYVKKIKLLKIRFPIPSKNVLIVHIEKKIENS